MQLYERLIAALLIPGLSVMFAQSGGSPAFEVASIKPADSSLDPGPAKRIQYGPDGLKIYGATVSRLIHEAYQVPEGLIVGAPDWALNKAFDVFAKPAAPADRSQLQLMLRQLLTDRCHLAVRAQRKEMPFYELTVRDPAKLYSLAADAVVTSKDMEAVGANRQLDKQAVSEAGGAGMMTCHCTLQELAAALTNLGREIGRPVIDKSGLEGVYLFMPRFYAGELFTLLDTQYGITLVSKKGPVDTLVVGRIDRPSSN